MSKQQQADAERKATRAEAIEDLNEVRAAKEQAIEEARTACRRAQARCYRGS